jgi:hypothetical protein
MRQLTMIRCFGHFCRWAGHGPSTGWRPIDDCASRAIRPFYWHADAETEHAERRARRDFIGLVAGWSGGLVLVLFIPALGRYAG